jgi:hypothetical protein
MQSNSKLTKAQKTGLKTLKRALPHVQFAHMGKTTVAFKHTGNLVEFATAICADNEKKNRPKVGQLYALSRFDFGQTVKMPFTQFDNMVESAFWD